MKDEKESDIKSEELSFVFDKLEEKVLNLSNKLSVKKFG